MATSRLRVEFIRFALLLTITAALISVALRHDDNDGSRPQASHGNSSASPSPGTSSPSDGGSSSAPASEQPSTGMTPSGSSGSGSGGSDSAGSGDGQSGGSDGSGSGSAGGTGNGGSAPTLPRTGGAQAAELAALAALFIGAGTAGVRLSRRQPASGSIALTQPGHAEGSSESNLPGTD